MVRYAYCIHAMRTLRRTFGRASPKMTENKAFKVKHGRAWLSEKNDQTEKNTP
jgi:hypothetical protein